VEVAGGYASHMERTTSYRGIDIVVHVNTMPGRRMRWRYETSSGQAGDGATTFGVEAAFKSGVDAAQLAIDDAADA
jgi:hypothetical protein